MGQNLIKVKTDFLLLDKDNRRGLSKRDSSFLKLDDNQQQLALLFCLVAFDGVFTLIRDMISDAILTDDLLIIDKIIIQDNGIENKFIVKEGNRRISSIKIIQNLSLLDKAKVLAIEKELFDLEAIKKFGKESEKIKKVVKNSRTNFLSELEVIKYTNSEEDTKRLNTILHRLHVEQHKNRWDSADKRLTDYDNIMKLINKGAETIDEAIDQLIYDNYSFNDSELGSVKSDFKKHFIYTHFTKTLMDDMNEDNQISIEDKHKVQKRMSNSYYLPIAQVIPAMLKKGFGIEYSIKIDRNSLKAYYEQKEGNIKVTSIKEMVYDLFLAIMNLDGKKPYPHNTFKTSKEFKKNFNTIYTKYVTEEIIKDNVEENASSKKINPEIIYHDGSANNPIITFKLNEATKLALNTIIKYGRNENDIIVNTNHIYVKVIDSNVEIKRDTLNKVMIDVPENPSDINIEFYFDDSYSSKIASLTLRYKLDEINPFTASEFYIVDTTLVKQEKELKYIDISNELKVELEKFKYSEYKYISSYIYRGLWENSIDILIIESDSSSIHNKVTNNIKRGDQVKDIDELVKLTFGSNSKVKKFAQFYGLTNNAAKNGFFSSSPSCQYKEKYNDLNNAPHGNSQAQSLLDIDDARKKTSKWLYIMNYMIYCCKNGENYS